MSFNVFNSTFTVYAARPNFCAIMNQSSSADTTHKREATTLSYSSESATLALVPGPWAVRPGLALAGLSLPRPRLQLYASHGSMAWRRRLSGLGHGLGRGADPPGRVCAAARESAASLHTFQFMNMWSMRRHAHRCTTLLGNSAVKNRDLTATCFLEIAVVHSTRGHVGTLHGGGG